MEQKEDWIDYDSYILSMSWGPAFCFNEQENKLEFFDRLEKLNFSNSFVINGLWPFYASGESISNCNDDDYIKVKFNKEIEKTLSKKWAGLGEPSHEKWNNEYNNHGYCYIKRLRKNVKKDYEKNFNKTLEKFGDLNFLIEHLFPDTRQGLHTIFKPKFE